MLLAPFQKDLLKNISTWLELLEELSKNTTDTSGLPKLEVSLRSGNLFSGSVVGLKRSVEENLLMLLEDAELHARPRLHLIQCEDITALSFVDPSVLLSLVSKDKPIVPELELKRRIKTIEDKIEEFVASRIPISLNQLSERDRNQAIQLIEELPSIFVKLMKDQIGKNILTESISSIEIQMGETATAKLNNKQLLCIFEKDSEIFLSKQKETLFNSIEKAL